MKISRFVLVLFCLALLVSAASMAASDDLPPCPVYSDPVSWASLPANPDKAVDVFYLYPTVYQGKSPKNMDIRDESMRALVRPLLVAQAGVYVDDANLFAPYYRQVSLACLDPEVDMYFHPNFRVGADDAQRAFEYYLANLNQGRPFILAGHSQGSSVLIDLLRRRFHDPKLRERMVAAYLIGYSVTDQDLKKYPWLKIAQRADDTGVIITYNTQAPGATGSPVLSKGAVCVNPLNWTSTATSADKSLNLGAVFFDNNTGKIEREVPHYVGARVDLKTGALIASPPDKLEIGHFPAGIFHKYDYVFWYRNLQQNVGVRVKAYMDAHK